MLFQAAGVVAGCYAELGSECHPVQRAAILSCLCLQKLLRNTAQPQRQPSQGKGVGQFHEDRRLGCTLGFWGNCRTTTGAESLALPASFSYKPWPSSPTRGKGSLEVLTFAHVYLCSNRGLLSNIMISNSSIHLPANGSIFIFL